jgi:hypothetical protein
MKPHPWKRHFWDVTNEGQGVDFEGYQEGQRMTIHRRERFVLDLAMSRRCAVTAGNRKRLAARHAR